MPFDLNNLSVTPANDCNIDADGVNLDEVDEEHDCADCGGVMNIGEYRAAGVCTECYFRNYDHDED